MKAHGCPINDDWSNISLAQFNTYIEEKGFLSLGGYITNLLLNGISRKDIHQAIVNIQSKIRQFNALTFKENLITAVIKIQALSRGYYTRATVMTVGVCAF